MHENLRSLRDMRASPRYPTRIDGQVAQGRVTAPVMIADISIDGALIRTTAVLRVGSTVTLTARALEGSATIMWHRPGEYGLRFAVSINPLEVVRQNVAGLEHLRREGR